MQVMLPNDWHISCRPSGLPRTNLGHSSAPLVAHDEAQDQTRGAARVLHDRHMPRGRDDGSFRARMQWAVASAISRYQRRVRSPRRTSTGSRSLRSSLHASRGAGAAYVGPTVAALVSTSSCVACGSRRNPPGLPSTQSISASAARSTQPAWMLSRSAATIESRLASSAEKPAVEDGTRLPKGGSMRVRLRSSRGDVAPSAGRHRRHRNVRPNGRVGERSQEPIQVRTLFLKAVVNASRRGRIGQWKRRLTAITR